MMIVWGATKEQIEHVVANVSTKYAGNIQFKREPEKHGRGFSFTITVKDSKGPGSRRSPTGRRIAAACWHVNRDMYKMIFDLNPNARIKTAIADYKGRSDFLDKFPHTGYQNIGSQFAPAYLADCCNCV